VSPYSPKGGPHTIPSVQGGGKKVERQGKEKKLALRGEKNGKKASLPVGEERKNVPFTPSGGAKGAFGRQFSFEKEQSFFCG